MKCKLPMCERDAARRGWCGMHYMRWYRWGDPAYVGKASPGEGNLTERGYVRVTVDGNRNYEHIATAEKALGRKLPPGAVVHHVDGNKSNNSPSNLVICPSKEYHELLHRRQKMLNITF